MHTHSILLEVNDNIAFITLNRPEKLNAFNREMALLLQNKLDECASSHAIRCVLIKGAGKAFCAGQDLAEVTDPNGPGMEKILSEHYNPIITRIRNMPKPVIAAVNGVAAGAGANIALACDIVVAIETASFIQAFSKIGLIPDSGGTFFLPRLIGFQRASALMMLGESITAKEAAQMGMLYKVFSTDLFEEESENIAKTVAQMPTTALAYIKHALNYSASNNLEQQLQLEDEYQQKAALTHDFKEGVEAFIQKRKPLFTGK
ncbi:MAG: enoyl-CoA hydratase/isomerase family protein [Bacteroidota bacterium]|nr:enoyl-CoA hydratase/isomerase family protein [Bacteroidota bacterium]